MEVNGKLLKQLKCLTENRINDFVNTQVLHYYVNTFYSNLSGWFYAIKLDYIGNLYIEGPISNGNTTTRALEGKEIVLYTINLGQEIELNINEYDIINHLDEREINKIIDEFKKNKDIDSIDLNYICNNFNLEIEEMLDNIYPGIYKEIKDEAIRLQWDIYTCNAIEQNIWDNINNYLELIEE